MNILHYLIALIILAIVSSIGNATDCGGRLSSPEINLTSPNYPQDYPDNQDCIWMIDFLKGQTIMVQFQEFDLEYDYHCKLDYLELRDGNNENATIIGNQMCGNFLHSTIFTSTNELFIRFRTNGVGSKSGFRILITASPNCTRDVDCSKDYYCRFADNRWSLSAKNKPDISSSTNLSRSCVRKNPCDQTPMAARDYSTCHLDVDWSDITEYFSYFRSDTTISGCKSWSDRTGCGRNENSYENFYECNKACGCSTDQFTCGDRRCVTNDFMCDGKDDCTDRSDEKHCAIYKICSLIAGSLVETNRFIGRTKNELECFVKAQNQRREVALAATWHRYKEDCYAKNKNEYYAGNKMKFGPVNDLESESQTCIFLMNETCKTIGDPSNISACRFPFQYQNQRNTKCIWGNDGPWCATLDENGWGFRGNDCTMATDHWNEWSEWSPCSKDCGDGIQKSARSNEE